MDFFGMGMGEILLVIIVALIIWGPNRIPEIARTMGRVVRTLRKTTSELTDTVTKELKAEENDHRPPSHRITGGAKTEESPPADPVEPDAAETSPKDQ